MVYLVLDPGKTTGFAVFDKKGELLALGSKKIDELADWLETVDGVTRVIYENYRMRPNVPQHWSTPVAIVAIGIIQSYCNRRKIPITRQEPACKTTGYAWMGEKPPKKKSASHSMDAMAHGVYYLQKNKIREARL